MTRRRLVPAFWLRAAALLVAAALVAIVALVRGELMETDGEILLTLGVLFLAGALGPAGLALVDADRFVIARPAPHEGLEVRLARGERLLLRRRVQSDARGARSLARNGAHSGAESQQGSIVDARRNLGPLTELHAVTCPG